MIAVTGHVEPCGHKYEVEKMSEQESRTKYVLSLCDRTGNMVRPWARAGYICFAVDTAHDGHQVEQVGDGAIRYIESDVREFTPPDVDYAAAFAFAPCTDLAVSGAAWFKQKGLRRLADAIDIVGACHEILTDTNGPWMLENPVSTLSTYWREPDYRFDPYEYTGYVDRDESYTKETWLWTGHGFRMPVTDGVSSDQADNRIHTMPPSEDRSERRAETPRGFARAVFLAHQDPETYARSGTGHEQPELTDVIA